VTDNNLTAPHPLGRAPAWAGTVLLAAEWVCVLAATALWASERPAQGVIVLGYPLWLAAWVWRWLRVGRPTRATGLEWPLLLFLLTALVGLWAAPSQGVAQARLDLFLGAVGIYFLIANSPRTSRHLFAYLLGIVAVALAVYFASQHDWTNAPAKFAIIGRVGRWFNRHMPALHLYQPNANVVANLLVLVLPVSVIQTLTGLAGWRRAGWAGRLLVALSGLSAVAIGAGLVMTESRASALGLAGAAGLAAWWWLAGRLAQSQHRLAIFGTGVAAGIAALVLLALAAPNGVTLALGSLPGPNSAISRTELYGQVWRLAQATPFTGGGLAAFPGLYSTYILAVPNLYLTHAHDAYLNILVEQGWPGLIGFVSVIAAGLWLGLRRLRQPAAEHDVLVAAGVLGLAVLSLQALGDGTLVASRIALAWLIPAGLAVGGPAASISPPQSELAESKPRPVARRLPGWLVWSTAVFAVVGVFGLLTWHSWLSAWYANLGAVAFARVQLENWPTNTWSTGQAAERLGALQPEFDRALTIDPSNETARYRLALLAGEQRDYASAVARLASAQPAEPGHRGITKTLAYAYVWTGDLQAARPLLKQVPEASNEMSVYTWWWGTQGRPDLAQRAAAAVNDLAAAR